jgi:hypothetical protein
VLLAGTVPEVDVVGLVFDSGVVDHHVVFQGDLSKGAGRCFVITGVAKRGSQPIGELVREAPNRGVHLGLTVGVAGAQSQRSGNVGAGAGRRYLGDQVEHPADGVGAVEHRACPADQLHGLDVGDIDEPGDLAEVGLPSRVVQAQAILKKEHPMAALTSYDRPHLIGSDAVDVDSRLVSQKVGRVVRLPLFYLQRLDHDDRRRDVEDLFLGPGGGDRGLTEERDLLFVLGLLGRLLFLGDGSLSRSPRGHEGQQKDERQHSPDDESVLAMPIKLR